MVQTGEIILDENNCDELGINLEQFILDFSKTKADGIVSEEELAEAYGNLRMERIVELSLEEMAEDDLVKSRIDPKTGKKLYHVLDKNAKT